MTVVTEPTSAIQQYLATLRPELDALGPRESDEVIAEIHGLLAEATADAGGDENAAVAGIGSPQVLAARILEERGVLAVETRVPEVPAKLRTLATIIDVVLLLAALILAWSFLAVPVGATFMAVGAGRLVSVVLAVVVVAAAVGVSVWWLRTARHKPGVTTSGMAVLGLRRIKVGDTTRLVRTRDIAGAVAPSRSIAAIKIALAALLVVAFAVSLGAGARDATDRDVETTMSAASTAATVVTEMYRGVLTGKPDDYIAGAFGPEATDAKDDIVARRARGELGSYAVLDIGATDYRTTTEDLMGHGGDLIFTVTVIEYDNTDTAATNYRYTVRLSMESLGDGGASGQWFIDSVERLD